ncbi:MAG: sugar kinase [Stackebrandtia sp.]
MNTVTPRSAFDLIGIGESMALVAPDPPAPLRDRPRLRMGVAGAESNVVTYLALLGATSAWAGRVGDDPFGELVCRQLAAVGADTGYIEIDKQLPTGVYFKDPDHMNTRVYYYRGGSAATGMNRKMVDNLPDTKIVHLTGITASLSDSCLDMMVHALIERPWPDALMSFDVNYRPKLWPVETASSVIRTLAGSADLVFVGLDEAETLWGTARPDDVRVHLPGPQTLVVKNAEIGATVYEGTSDGVFLDAPIVKVVEPVGAGDAFAAGYLFAVLKGAVPRARLRMGHLIAAGALRVSGDIGPLPGSAWITAALNDGTPQ